MFINHTNLVTFFLTLSLFFLSFGSFAKEKPLKLKKGRVFVVTIKTNQGDIVIELLNETPLHRDNFANKANTKFYDNLLFHRVIKDFMIQAGDPNTRDRSDQARSKYGSSSKDEVKIEAEINPSIFHYRGALGAAREGRNNPEKVSSSSQFYIVQRPSNDKLKKNLDKATKLSAEQQEYIKRGGTPHLDGDYTVFGYVLKGMDVVDKIAAVECNELDRPKKDVEILTTEVKQYKKKKLHE